jgi:hypothetical protein
MIQSIEQMGKQRLRHAWGYPADQRHCQTLTLGLASFWAPKGGREESLAAEGEMLALATPGEAKQLLTVTFWEEGGAF